MKKFNIKDYAELSSILRKIGFELLEERIQEDGKFVDSRWISNSCLLLVTNANIEVDNAGLDLSFLHEHRILCDSLTI
jgi:hypothetical protein